MSKRTPTPPPPRQWAEWIIEALTPTPTEVRRVAAPTPRVAMDQLRSITEPTDDEVHRLLANRAAWAERRRRRRRAWAISGVMAGAVATLMLTVAVGQLAQIEPAASYDPVAIAVGEEVWIGIAAVDLGPSIDVSGSALVRIVQADADGTVIEVLEGNAIFDVDPAGPFSDLTVKIGALSLTGASGRFEVLAEPNLTHVDVMSGELVAQEVGRQVRIAAGSSQSFGAVGKLDKIEVVQPAPTPAPAVEVRPEPRRVLAPAPTPIEPPAPTVSADTRAFLDIQDRMDAGADAEELRNRLSRFVRQYPRSSHRHEAEYYELVYTAETIDPQLAITAISNYRRKNAKARRDLDLAWVQATLIRDRAKDCKGALPLYRRIAERGGGTMAAKARAWQGLCARAVGNADEAREALDDAAMRDLPGDLKQQVQAARKNLKD